jgi:hypothetical protein
LPSSARQLALAARESRSGALLFRTMPVFPT